MRTTVPVASCESLRVFGSTFHRLARLSEHERSRPVSCAVPPATRNVSYCRAYSSSTVAVYLHHGRRATGSLSSHSYMYFWSHLWPTLVDFVPTENQLTPDHAVSHSTFLTLEHDDRNAGFQHNHASTTTRRRVRAAPRRGGRVLHFLKAFHLHIMNFSLVPSHFEKVFSCWACYKGGRAASRGLWS